VRNAEREEKRPTAEGGQKSEVRSQRSEARQKREYEQEQEDEEDSQESRFYIEWVIRFP
jgi:hypothetical protein